MALANLPLDELIVTLKDPATKTAILSQADAPPDPDVLFDGIGAFLGMMIDKCIAGPIVDGESAQRLRRMGRGTRATRHRLQGG